MATTSSPSPAVRPDKELLTGWLLLLLDRGATYGYKLRGDLDAQHLNIDPGTVYRSLRKLERDGLVQSRWMGSVAGPRRRFYRLTPKGRRLLDDIAELIRTIRDTHDAFVHAYEHAVTGTDEVAADDAVADVTADEVVDETPTQS